MYYKIGNLKLVDKFLWFPIKFNNRWHWWKKVCMMQKLTETPRGNVWVTVKIMEF